MSAFQEFKLVLLDFLPLSRDGFHIYLGLLCYLAGCVLTRRPLSHWALLSFPLVVALFVEGIDLADDVDTFGSPRWGESISDLVNTLLAPLAIAATA